MRRKEGAGEEGRKEEGEYLGSGTYIFQYVRQQISCSQVKRSYQIKTKQNTTKHKNSLLPQIHKRTQGNFGGDKYV